VPRHDLDLVSLVAGVAFAGLGVTALLARAGIPPRWALPFLLIALGVTGLLATSARAARLDRSAGPGPDQGE